MSPPDNIGIVRTTQLIEPRDTPHWSRVCVSALLVLGVVAMANMLGANPDSMALSSSHDTALTQHGVAAAPFHGTEDSAGLPAATVKPPLGSGESLSDCFGLVMLCMAMVIGISALLLSRRAPGGHVMWQLPRPHTIALGRAVAPFCSATPLQRTAVLRL